MRYLLLIFTLFASMNSWAQQIQLEESTPTLSTTLADLSSEAQLENLERANIFAAEVSDDEGGWSGNGGGSRDESDNIWFIGDQPIKYCFSKSATFPLKGKELQQMIQNGINKWMEFFKSYHLLDNKLAGGFDHPRMNMMQFSDGKNRGLSKEFTYTNDCSEARLQFLFGIENNIIKNYKKFASDHPYGLAVRQKYDHKNFAHKGIVWVDNFSKEKIEIKHILLHELGHVFGMKHDSVPAMDEELIKRMGQRRGQFLSNFLGKIELDAWTFGHKKDHPIVMTSTRGFKPRQMGRRNRRDDKNEEFCGDSTFAVNRKIPRKILRGLNLNFNDCHRMTLTYLGKANRGPRKKQSFKLEIEELLSKRKAVFTGVFKRSEGTRPSISGPGVVTELNGHNPNAKKKIFRKLSLKKSGDLLPLTGKFKLGREEFAAKMTSNKGLVIELFIPSAGTWWTFKTHFNQF